MNTERNYSERKFWNKLTGMTKQTGKSAVYITLLLYYVLQKPQLPKKAKAIIVSALGYLILPFDIIPDVTIGIGFTDDISMLFSAFLAVSVYIDEEVKQQAKARLANWFGDGVNIDNKYRSH